MSNPFTDPFYVGELCAPLSAYTPSVWKEFYVECCGNTDPILECLQKIKECLEQEKDYEFARESFCELLADGTEVNFVRITKLTFDKKTGDVVKEVEDVLPDLTTPYVVIDPSEVYIRKTKTQEICEGTVNSGVQTSWTNL